MYLRAVVAIIPGLFLCLTDSKLRRLAIWPWIIGTVCYSISIFGAWKAHPLLVSHLVSDTQGIVRWVIYWLVWLAAAVMLLGASFVISVIVIQIFTSGFQSAIAAHVLHRLGQTFPQQAAPGLGGTIVDVLRTMKVESGKLLVLIPCLALVFILGFIPVLIPFAVLGAAWLLAYQFMDIILDLYRIPVRERFRLCAHQKMLLICFGLGLTAVWAIPFAGILLAPAAAAGGAWLLSGSRFLSEVQSVSTGALNRSAHRP